MLRDSIKAAQISSMKSGDKPRLAAVRLILAKLKDKDIELRTAAAILVPAHARGFGRTTNPATPVRAPPLA